MQPLAERLRPKTLDEYIGQKHLVGPGAVLRKMIDAGRISSFILWGPPGVGKTTLAQIIANKLETPFYTLSAVTSGVKDVRDVIDRAKSNRFFSQASPILFIDEIHRFSKSQQDSLLGAVEQGTVTLIGATTENPSFEVIRPLLSRCQLYVLKYKMVLLKSSILGVFIGAVPGTGAAISSFLAYNEAKRTSKHPEEYGHGSEEAVVASESANNAVTGATLIPLLTLGIPGDTNTAVLLGALTMQGIAAGPQLFTQHGEWVYTIMLGLIAVNIFMYLQGRVFIRGFVNITRVPTSTLVPILVMLCVIGAYAIDYSVFNAIFMVGVGIFGYFMTKLDMPMTPMVIGLVLGKLCESNLRRALIVSKGSWATFFTSPISLFFILLSLFMLFFPYIKKKLAARRAAA